MKELLRVLALAACVMTALVATPSGGAGVEPGTLTVYLTGTGNGQVSFTDSNNAPVTCSRTDGINDPLGCSAAYSAAYPHGHYREITATVAAGSSFAGWMVSPETAIVSDCGLAVACNVNVAANPVVTATFTANPGTFPLSVVKAGPGSGTVTSAPAGIDCGTDCSESYTEGSMVTLTATAGAGSTFTGWSGGCTGTGSCMVTMNSVVFVSATFTTTTFPLTVTFAGAAQSGVVSSIPPGVMCLATCSASFASGTQVSLTALALAGFAFQGWSGAGCAGAGTCIVAMTQAQNVSATFVPSTPSGSGAVEAFVVRNRIRKVGPNRAIRQLQVTVDAEEDLRRIVLRVRRRGVILQTRRVRNFDADTAVIRINLRNGIASGRAQLQVTFRNESGTQKVQTRRIRIPRL